MAFNYSLLNNLESIRLHLGGFQASCLSEWTSTKCWGPGSGDCGSEDQVLAIFVKVCGWSFSADCRTLCFLPPHSAWHVILMSLRTSLGMQPVTWREVVPVLQSSCLKATWGIINSGWWKPPIFFHFLSRIMQTFTKSGKANVISISWYCRWSRNIYCPNSGVYRT